jgi:hypothetical protein
MSGRVALSAVAVALALGGTPEGGGAAEAAGKWCKTYCDGIHVACQKTVGWLDEDACDEWHRGCLDGCDVNERR